MTKEEMLTMRDNLDPKVDNGLTPSTKAMTEAQRKITALVIAVNASIVQFVVEGLLPPEQQAHFMMHLQDFATRLYAGENVEFPAAGAVADLTNDEIEVVSQTFSVDSRLGEVYLAAAELALTDGRMTRKEDGKEANVNRPRLN